MKPKAGDLLFVYGTLRPGERADLSHHSKAEYIGEDRIYGLLYNTGVYPAAKTILGPGDPSKLPVIYGDVFKINSLDTWEMLDIYEGYPELFDRKRVTTLNNREAWIYVFTRGLFDEARIRSGNWKER